MKSDRRGFLWAAAALGIPSVSLMGRPAQAKDGQKKPESDEDISAPECFEIEKQLIMRLLQPVMHDDVHGTAVVGVAAVKVACKHAGIDLHAATVGQLGLGAAGSGIAALMVEAGVKRVIAFDPQEPSHQRARENLVRDDRAGWTRCRRLAN